MSSPNTWAKATVQNDWGSKISKVELHHRYDNDHKDDKSWTSIENGQQGDEFDIGYWTGFGRTGYDYWLITFKADGKSWTCKDNFYCFLTDEDKGGKVICRVCKDGDTGKMEVICPKSSGATVELSSKSLQPGENPDITPCDGTITPQKWKAYFRSDLNVTPGDSDIALEYGDDDPQPSVMPESSAASSCPSKDS